MNIHANIFAQTLMYAIENVQNNDLSQILQFVKMYADTRFSWDVVIRKWKALIAALKEEHHDLIKSSTAS